MTGRADDGAGRPGRPGRRRVVTAARDLGVLAALGTTGALSGCTALERAGRRAGLIDPSPTPAPTAAPPADPDDPDVRLAVEVALVSEAAATALRTWASDDPRATRRTRRLAEEAAAVHGAHAELVGAAVPQTAEPASGRLSPALVDATRSPSGTLRSLVRIEELAGAGLREAALTARSGPFASLLASMVAASAQQSAVLRSAAPGPGRRAGRASGARG